MLNGWQTKMVRTTSGFGMAVAVYAANTRATKILDANPYRLLYSIQNLDAANYIAIGPKDHVTAGAFGLNEGQHLAPGQPMSDDTDQGEVWACADTAAVNIAVVEIATKPAVSRSRSKNPRRLHGLRPTERATLRREARTF